MTWFIQYILNPEFWASFFSIQEIEVKLPVDIKGRDQSSVYRWSWGRANVSPETISLCNKYGNCFPGGTSGEELATNAGDIRDVDSIPGWGRLPWRRAWQPTPVFLPGESHGQRSPAGYSPWGRRVRHDWNDLACMLTFVCIFISVAIAVHETLSHPSSKLGTHCWFFPTTYLHSVAEMTFPLFCDWRNSIDPSVFLY